jgi:hypothetical protein
MSRQSLSVWLPLWLRALDEEIGFAFTPSGCTREYFRNILYEARQQSGDPRLNALIMFMPGGKMSHEIWICKKEVSLDAD